MTFRSGGLPQIANGTTQIGGDLFLGLDVGTQGARCVACDAAGQVVAEATAAFEHGSTEPQPGWHEQDPEDWWQAALECLKAVAERAADAGWEPAALGRIAVTSTSGTIVLVDDEGQPLRPAVMYNDGRAADQAARINDAARLLIRKLGYRFSASFGLPKILWLAEHEPETFDAARLCHPADFLVGRLTGRYDASDTSNLLKDGYDLVDRRWPAFIARDLGLPLSKLPGVLRPGEPVGHVVTEVVQSAGLSAAALVCAGATDGTAAFLASGAVAPGQWCSTLGTTLVLRGVSPDLVRDAQGRIYCHAHPEGGWLPGAASNVGGECLEAHFEGEDWAALDAGVADAQPNDLIVYPLARRGERFPFVDPEAEGFVHGRQRSKAKLYAAHLEGVGFVERWGLELMAELGAPVAGALCGSGGATASDVWLQLRADILDRAIQVAADAHSAKGAALLAAAGAFGSLSEAVVAMVHFHKAVEPRVTLRDYLDAKYARFREFCAERYPAAST
ncbi:MAG: FGGY-family carbohydrate kinase [Planctomycetota bacterium]